MQPATENRKRGRPKGSGKQLTASERAIKSRKVRLDAGYKRIEIWLSPLDAERLEWLQENKLWAPLPKLISHQILSNVGDFMALTKRQKKKQKMEKIPPPPKCEEFFTD